MFSGVLLVLAFLGMFFVSNGLGAVVKPGFVFPWMGAEFRYVSVRDF